MNLQIHNEMDLWQLSEKHLENCKGVIMSKQITIEEEAEIIYGKRKPNAEKIRQQLEKDAKRRKEYNYE